MDIMIDAFLDNNIGDDLMIRLLAERFPRHRFFLYSDLSVIAKTFSDVNNITVRRREQRESDISSSAVYIFLGGSRFQLATRRQRYWRVYIIHRVRRIKRKRVKVVTMGCNFGPYSNRLGVKLTEWQLRKSDLITVRDREALQFLKGFRRVSNYHLADDIVYNLKQAPFQGETARSGLGISAFRSILSSENNYENYKTLALLADDYIRKTGKRVFLFPFDSESQNDLAAAYHILNLAEEKDQIEIVPYLGDVQSFLAAFQACERIIALRFHSAILADLFEIPFLPVVYSNKMRNLLNDRGYKGMSIDLQDLTPDQDVGSLVDQVIAGDQLFNEFLGDQHTASVHFDRLEELLATIRN